MLVRPKAATWAGTPYVPEWHLVKEANEEADEKDWSHFCSVEMWLSDDEQERVKKGVLFGYNTVTGEPAVLFRQVMTVLVFTFPPTSSSVCWPLSMPTVCRVLLACTSGQDLAAIIAGR